MENKMVSIFSVRLLKPIPRSSRSVMVVIKCGRERPKWSSLKITKVSPAWVKENAASKPFRSVFAPLAVLVKILPHLLLQGILLRLRSRQDVHLAHLHSPALLSREQRAIPFADEESGSLLMPPGPSAFYGYTT
jgi:hypothetical protein